MQCKGTRGGLCPKPCFAQRTMVKHLETWMVCCAAASGMGWIETWCASCHSTHPDHLERSWWMENGRTVLDYSHIMHFPLSHKASYRNVNMKKIQCSLVCDSLRHFAHLTSSLHNGKARRRDSEPLGSRNHSTQQQPPVKQPHSCSKEFQLVTHPHEEPSASKSASILCWYAYSLHLTGYRCKQHSRLSPSKKLM